MTAPGARAGQPDPAAARTGDRWREGAPPSMRLTACGTAGPESGGGWRRGQLVPVGRRAAGTPPSMRLTACGTATGW